MFDPQRIPDNRLAREALVHARALAVWLVALQNAVASVNALCVADDALTSFRRDVPLAGDNPLAALGLAPDEATTEDAIASESASQRRRRDLLPTASTAGAMAQATAEPMLSGRNAGPVAPSPRPAPITVAPASPERVGSQRDDVASPAEQPLPTPEPLTLPASELQQMARAVPPQAREAPRPDSKVPQPISLSSVAGGPEQSGAAARQASLSKLRDQTPGQANSTEHWRMPRSERARAGSHLPVMPPGPITLSGSVSHTPPTPAVDEPARTTKAADITSPARATAVNPGALPPPLLAALAAGQPGMRAAGPVRSEDQIQVVSHPLSSTAADEQSQTTEAADVMARAGGTIVGREALPPHLLAALTARGPSARAAGPTDEASDANTAGSPVFPPSHRDARGRAAVPGAHSGLPRYRGRPIVPAHATGKEGLSAATAAGANLVDRMQAGRKAAAPSPPLASDSPNARWLRAAPLNMSSAGAALLRETLAHFASSAEPLVPVAEDRLTLATGEGAASTGVSTPSAESESLAFPAAPAIQNTFNVTVHMAGMTLANEEELAERLTRVLIEQARRNGIDI